MNETKKLTAFSERFIPGHQDFSHSPYTNTSLSIEVDLSEPTIEFRYRQEKDEILNRHVTHSYIYAELSEQQLIELMKFFTTPKPESKGETSTFTLQPTRVLCRYRRNNKDSTEVNPGHLLFEAHFDRIIIETFGGENQVIPYCEVEQGSTPQDRNNLKSVQRFATRLIELLEEGENSARDESGTSSFELTDSELSTRCISKFERGEYADAASTSLKVLEERVRANGDEDLADLYGKDLMMQAFSSDDGSLAFGENANEEQGVMFLYAGAMQALRNPLSHRTPDPEGSKHLDSFSEDDARSILYFVDFLISRV
ncbi:TIGR02391 family protein [Haladaptatus sp. DYF46]|uniref:TIGR02391 family protein n=1 Tax=Haladaptatus sp. DYF46 TaxID=2886041 RepID=UPI001E5DCF54|nr:TIGR02391 family protein [Haladaptatus sp. DYF46]